MYHDTPRDHIGTVYETLMFGDNPLGWETLGTKETIRGANRDTFLDYVDEWYTPDRMVVGVSGMVGDDLVPMLEELLGDMSPERRARQPAPAELRPRRRARTSPSTTRTPTRRHLILGVPSCRSSTPTATRCSCSSTVLGCGHVVTPLPRGARAPRPRLLRPRHRTTPTRTRARCYAQAGVDLDPDRRGDQGDRRAVPAHGRRAGAGRRAREGAVAGKGRFVLHTESPQGLIMFGLAARCSRARRSSRRSCSPSSTRSPPRTCSASRRT